MRRRVRAVHGGRVLSPLAVSILSRLDSLTCYSRRWLSRFGIAQHPDEIVAHGYVGGRDDDQAVLIL
jgi:hypothetical protein